MRKKRTWKDLTHDEKHWIVVGHRAGGGLNLAGQYLDQLYYDEWTHDEMVEAIEMEEELGWWNDTTTTREQWRASRK